METSFKHRKFAEALTQSSTLLEMLRKMPGNPWVGYFDRLEHALIQQDVEGAVRARDSIPGPGMGGFGEFLENHPQIWSAHRELMNLVGDLKLHSRYGVERERHRVGT